MQPGERIEMRTLPAGETHPGAVVSVQGDEVALDVEGIEFRSGCPVEIKTGAAIFLGVVARAEGPRVWIGIEHYLEQKTIAKLQAAWNEPA